MKKRKEPADCPCGNAVGYLDCCGRHIEGAEPAPTALELMRSRYTAYVLESGAYLLSTWHPSSRPPRMSFDPPAPRWLGLAIRDAVVTDPGHATVEFVARYRVGGRAHRLHEKSRFVLEEGRWYYVDGEMLS